MRYIPNPKDLIIDLISQETWDNLPEVFDNNNGNNTYEEITIYFKNEKRKYEELQAKISSYVKNPGDAYDKYIKQIDKIIKSLSTFGYDGINYRNKYKYLFDLKEELSDRFNNKFGRLKIVYNTTKEFQLQLQTIFDDIASYYDTRLASLELFKKQYFKDGKLIEDINLNDINVNQFFEYADNNEKEFSPKNLINSNVNIGKGIKNQLLSLQMFGDYESKLLRNYLNEFYDLFETVWWDDGGYQFEY